MIRPLRSDRNYDAALNQIEEWVESKPKQVSPDADRFDLLTLIIKGSEQRHSPIERTGAVDSIRCSRVEQAAPLPANSRHLLARASAA